MKTKGGVIVTALIAGLWCFTSAMAQGIEPVAVKISDPEQTKDLIVMEVQLSVEQLAPLAGDVPFAMRRWSVKHTGSAFDQLQIRQPAKDGKLLSVFALVRKASNGTIDFYNSGVQEALDTPLFSIEIDLSTASVADPSVLSDWASLKTRKIVSQYRGAESVGQIAYVWAAASASAHGAKDFQMPSDRNRRSRRRGRRGDLNAFSIFSGEAAILETLQEQVLGASDSNTEFADIFVSELTGPEIKSHPYKEMLGGSSGASLALANLVPMDRYFVHIAQPGQALDWVDKLGAVGADLAGMKQGSSINRGLIDRYLARLGLPRNLIKPLSGFANEAVLFGPDLYLTNGSHVTLLATAPSAPALKQWLKLLLGVSPGDGVAAYGAKSNAWFASHEDKLIFSTSQSEAESALALARSGGNGSLGSSDEFRYMLSLMPPDAGRGETGPLVYLSDPFIRAMVGPHVKIAQFRRHQARTRLSAIGAAAMLYRWDHQKPATLDELLRLEYVQKKWLEDVHGDAITLDQNGIAHSSLYGSLAEMTPIQDISLAAITQSEMESYQGYVEDYSRFWRQFFDPIAIRFQLESPVTVETLILPLVQNSIYESVRATIGGDPVEMALPNITPRPVSTFSFKLNDDFLREFRPFQSDLDEELVTLLGNSVQFSIYDSDPIVALGSADLLGAFSGGMFGGRGSDMISIGMLVSSLTQPAALFVKLEDGAELTDSVINRLATGLPARNFGFGNSDMDRIIDGDKKKWVYTWNLENIIRMHFYIQQVGDYAVISNRNLPFAKSEKQDQQNSFMANAGISISFDQIERLASSLDLHHQQRDATNAFIGAGELRPLMLAGANGVDEALSQYRAFFGTVPKHPTGGSWEWEESSQSLRSTKFGTLWDRTMDEYVAGSSAGPMRNLKALGLQFSFEQDGVRVKLKLEGK